MRDRTCAPLIAGLCGLALAGSLAACTGRAREGGAQPTATPHAAPAVHRPATKTTAAAPSAAPASRVATARPLAVRTPPPTPSVPHTAILSAGVAPTLVHAGSTVNWDVRTTPDVTAVEAHVNVATLSLVRAGPGHFVLGFRIPDVVPSFFHGHYAVAIIAHGAGGATATTSVSLSFR